MIFGNNNNNNKDDKNTIEIKINKVEQKVFDNKRDNISRENNLVRCPTCGKLLSKVLDESKTIQHRGLQAVVSGVVIIKCMDCDTIIEF